MKLTDWFPPHVKPVRVGVYQRYVGGDFVYARWNGKEWKYGWPTVSDAVKERWSSAWQYMEWRGLAEPPK